MELYYAFIKDGRVANVAVFAEENQELADIICNEKQKRRDMKNYTKYRYKCQFKLITA